MLILTLGDTMEGEQVKTLDKNKEDYLKKYAKEIKAVMPKCVFDKKQTAIINKDNLIGKKLLVLKKEEHKNPFGRPYLVVWFGIIDQQQGFVCWSKDNRSVAFTVGYSKLNQQFYDTVDAGDVVTLSRQIVGRIVSFPCKIIQKASSPVDFA